MIRSYLSSKICASTQMTTKFSASASSIHSCYSCIPDANWTGSSSRHLILRARRHNQIPGRIQHLQYFSAVSKINPESSTKESVLEDSVELSKEESRAEMTKLLRSVIRRKTHNQRSETTPLEQQILGRRRDSVSGARLTQDLRPDPKRQWWIHPDLRPHIRASLNDIEFESDEMQSRDTGLSVCTLGSGAGLGSRLRANSATIIKQNGDAYLVDAGEGVSRQLHSSRITLSSIRKIFSEFCSEQRVFGLCTCVCVCYCCNERE